MGTTARSWSSQATAAPTTATHSTGNHHCTWSVSPSHAFAGRVKIATARETRPGAGAEAGIEDAAAGTGDSMRSSIRRGGSSGSNRGDYGDAEPPVKPPDTGAGIGPPGAALAHPGPRSAAAPLRGGRRVEMARWERRGARQWRLNLTGTATQ